ncbi:GNAT family N-acetyltransferase [Microvirga guangxiensis]|uniref:Acetyltransferase (GNAT) domain-containing protein n=1 Tax=Microvirga guangxiensis TaxID=549386 RepID=A0A1G5G5Q0_9HYPH|nr:GNAT family N-acetyltransferase [Microvirga guangxiensis]SCY46667.1 Acetyltransferase (GNAT) domain-containing protein [Microvirga guangxiensis]
MFAFQPITPDTEGFDALLRASLSENHGMLQRLQENWRNGANRFSRPGETLLGAFDGRSLVGICGRNIDPYTGNPKAGRVRHLYVAPPGRRQGIGRMLVTAIAECAVPFFGHLNARAPEFAFPFYERLGFSRIENDPYVTHRLRLKA